MSGAFDDFERVDELLRRALELPPEQRADAVRRWCDGDRVLEQKVLELLAASGTGDSLEPGGGFDANLWSEVARAGVEDGTEGAARARGLAGRRFGPYRAEEEIGRGGMAVVYRGERVDGVYEQRVAIKVLDGWRLTADLERRFVQERQILARLEHPHIARLIDGGTTDEGHLYLVMEHVDGEPIDRYCDRRRLSVDERLELFLQVADAVQFAHRNLVVHRDLKPSNILVTDGGEPKLLDFGIAKLLAEDGPDQSAPQTATWNRLLTPQYASPEQILGEPISTSTDVHALGLLLYELLSGARARPVTTLTPRDLVDSAQSGISRPPSLAARTPSEEVTGGTGLPDPVERARVRSTTPARLVQRLRGDLDTVVLEALRREPEQRYLSVRELADDLRRHLAGLPGHARGSSWAYRLRKLARRRAGTLVAAALVLGSLVVGLLGTALQARRATREAERAAAVTDFVVDLLRDSDPEISQGRDVTVREVLDRAARGPALQRGAQPELGATLRQVMGTIYGQLGLLEEGVEQARLALAARRSIGAQPEELASTHDLLAEMLIGLGELDEAEQHASMAVELLRRGDPEPADLGDALATLAKVRFERGEADTGRALVDEAVSLFRGVTDADEKLARALNQAAIYDRDASRFDEARAHAIEASQLGDPEVPTLERVDALHTLASVAMMRGKTEDLKEGQAAIEQAIDEAGRLLGSEHPRVALLYGDLASIRARRGDVEGGEAAYAQSIETLRERFGDDHPLVATAHNNLAVFHYRMGRFADAIEGYERSLAVRHEALPADHPLVATTRGYLGLALHRAGDPRAESVYRQALDELVASRGAEHEKVGNLRADLGMLLTEQERFEEAEEHLRAALEILVPIFGEDDGRVDNPRGALGFLLCATGRRQEGEELLAASRSWREAISAEGEPLLLQQQIYEAACLAAAGETELARDQTSSAAATLIERLRDGHYLARWARRVSARQRRAPPRTGGS
ncbi:MAG: hypothetical protein DWQ30_23470 [Acidobacteria bacterium]|nr:MAG: hypothetical protein DWQ30_23470 [Acidobacteriota bacterium]